MKIIDIEATHYPQIAEIYMQGIATGNATFQSEAPCWEDWDKNHLSHCRFAALDNNDMAGWAALSPVSGRCVYAGVAETSIYIACCYRGSGVGKLLLAELISQSEQQGLWTLQAGIFPENTGSLQLHENLGFRQIGYREKIG
ncbi:MAG: N-acetyltransferase family protein, partial [Ferruginibacter sp.]